MTAHIDAKKEDIAKTVIMPGDPLRAKYIAETYLENYRLVNDVRSIYAFTGTYQGKEITIMASGMGMASIGIYSYELYKYYDVEQIIRVGTAGSYSNQLQVYDLLLVDKSYSDSSFAKVQNHTTDTILSASSELNEIIMKTAQDKNYHVVSGTVYSSDVFYKEEDNFQQIAQEHNCMACEMESFALFHNAKVLNKKAACLLTISNHFLTGEETTSEEREIGFHKMMELALESSLHLS